MEFHQVGVIEGTTVESLLLIRVPRMTVTPHPALGRSSVMVEVYEPSVRVSGSEGGKGGVSLAAK